MSYYFHPADFRPGGASTPDQKISLLELIILVLTVYWLLSFFGQSIVPGIRTQVVSSTCYPSLLLS